MIPKIGDASLWSQFGLAGLVIFALFAILVTVVWFTVKRFDAIDERSTEHSKDIHMMHKEEREEWRQSSSKQLDKFEHAISRLADSIRDTRHK